MEGGLTTKRVSVIVPTRNSATYLCACLASIRAQTSQNIELIVVDNQSTDDTRVIAERFADRVLAGGPERSAQRNAGAGVATGSYLLFVDSDMVLEPPVVAECVEVAVTSSAGAVVVPELSFGSGFWAKCKALERSCYLGDETIEAARFFTRACFSSVGGFDAKLPPGPEDWDLHERVRSLGITISRTRALVHHNEGQLSLVELVSKKFYYGKAMGAYVARHPELARRQLKIVRPAFVRHWRRIIARPILAVGMIFMKSCEFAAGAAGVASARLRR